MENPKRFQELLKTFENMKKNEEYKKKYNPNKLTIKPPIDIKDSMRKNCPIKSYLIPSERKKTQILKNY